MAIHVITDPSTPVTDRTTPPVAGPDTPGSTVSEASASESATPVAGRAPELMAGWLSLGAAMADEAPAIADRDDLVVMIAPGAGHGAPAAFLPAHATIELDAHHLGGVHPASLTPALVADQNRVPTLWGLFTHECAHAQHSVWMTPPGTPAGVAAAAELLEESRIEAAQIRRRPDDRRWLRASSVALILDDMLVTTTSGGDAMTRHAAGHAAALLLARVDAGVLTPAETAPVAEAVTTALGAQVLARLRVIWLQAHRVADHETDAMLELGRRWCAALGTDPDTAPPTTDPAAEPGDGTSGDESGAGTGAGTAAPSPLSEATKKALDAVARAVAVESAPVSAAEEAASRAAEAAAESASADKRAGRAAAKVFPINRSESRGRGVVRLGDTRAPSDAERAAARVLGRALDTAGIRDRVPVKSAAVLPPGRLSLRGARALDAQRAAGAVPTAAPFTRVTRKVIPTPPLRVGIACDVSGSMGAFTGPVASAVWILAAAAGHTTVPATTASVIFGSSVLALTRPGEVPAKVTDFGAHDIYEDVPGAIDALDGALGLATPGAARLLVIISDGCYSHRGWTNGQARVTRLRASGCGVLWLAPASGAGGAMDGATVEQLRDPAATARAIGRAATAALRAAR